ncbi:alpha galactosidase A domain-containing protein [Hirsutella rhossiliensis]|uniref:Alpha-galactosidase n=1 Tax=Hirsutella rhossiliensis TaxID=111463 RepID=A0A9P8N3R2_9HYPO|nr:alpha galactosidase A domain-containing protein [Hirsutella rhossiliensis]KAH0967808.1 alpha galactosidase A domain-containing protein [Hirsutella rhossiliensis]
MMSQMLLAAAAGLVGTAALAPETVLPLPPMGFNNWARFTTNINEAIFVDAAEAMASRGLLAAGYNHVNLDDAWSTKSRAADGSMVWDSAKFPRGLPWLASHLKSRGFIPGIYSDAGTLSCGGYPAALGFEEIDFNDFVAWGFEYLKMDGCNLPDGSEATYRQVYGRWHQLLLQSESRMVFSDSAPAYFSGRENLTDWYTVMRWARKIGHLARHSADIVNYPDGNAWNSVLFNYGQHLRLARFQKPGFFNDPDFLIVDHPSFTLDEKKSHFALWCAFSAPLILSADLASIRDEEVEYLTNRDLIAINQDRLVQQATLVSSDANWDVLTKSLENGDRLVVTLNKRGSTADLTVSWERLGFSPSALRRAGDVSAKNLWTGKRSKISAQESGITAKGVPSHGTAVFRIARPASPITPTGLIFNTNSLKCLTDDKSGKVSWAKCNGSDAQTWKVRPDWHINSLLRPNECIADAQGRIFSSRSGCQSEAWFYQITGNLVNARTRLCLTERTDGAAVAAKCGYELNEQVVSLPIGAAVVGE